MKIPSLAGAKPEVVLVTVSGQDAPGITAALTSVLAQSNATILDIGQAQIYGLLSLSILIELNTAEAKEKTTIKDLLFRATELGLKLEFRVIDPELVPAAPTRGGGRRSSHYALTLLAERLTAEALHAVSSSLVRHGLNIDRIQRLSESGFSCVEMLVSTLDELDQLSLKDELLKIARNLGVDIALQAEGLFRRAKRLVVLDMDSTLIQNEVIDEFAREMGVYEDVASITREAMNGKMNFDESLRRRVAKLQGLTEQQIERVYQRLKLTPGAQDLVTVLQKLGYRVALISGGFSCIADRLKTKLGIDYAYANTLELQDGRVTGQVHPPIVNAQRKADLLDVIAQQEKISLDQVVAIGDGANDLLMLERAGLGIAFNAKPVVSAQADLALHQKNLSSILYLLGISGRDLSQVLGPK